jgi:hypothetical protein
MCYAENDPRASGLSPIFWREAGRLLPAYRSSDSATTLSALMVFSVASSLHGKNQLGLDLLSEGGAMAERLQLLGGIYKQFISCKLSAHGSRGN